MPRDNDTPFINRRNPNFPPAPVAEDSPAPIGKPRRWPWALALGLALVLGWVFRWETVTTADRDSSAFFMVNRWTGEIRVVFPGGYEPVTQAK